MNLAENRPSQKRLPPTLMRRGREEPAESAMVEPARSDMSAIRQACFWTNWWLTIQTSNCILPTGFRRRNIDPRWSRCTAWVTSLRECVAIRNYGHPARWELKEGAEMSVDNNKFTTFHW